VDDQITSKKLKKKNGGAPKSNKRIEILHQEKDMQKKKKIEERLSAKLICFCTRDSIKETTY
jgi:hypothetical protein